MHPDIEGPIREYAREFLLGEVGERGKYCRAAEKGNILFDDIYFLGVVRGAESVSLGATLESDEPDDITDSINNRAIGLIARLYNCSSDAAEERIKAIHAKVDG